MIPKNSVHYVIIFWHYISCLFLGPETGGVPTPEPRLPRVQRVLQLRLLHAGRNNAQVKHKSLTNPFKVRTRVVLLIWLHNGTICYLIYAKLIYICKLLSPPWVVKKYRVIKHTLIFSIYFSI